jgi:hypothetical protein
VLLATVAELAYLRVFVDIAYVELIWTIGPTIGDTRPVVRECVSVIPEMLIRTVRIKKLTISSDQLHQAILCHVKHDRILQTG